jgi:hypothetical protein
LFGQALPTQPKTSTLFRCRGTWSAMLVCKAFRKLLLETPGCGERLKAGREMAEAEVQAERRALALKEREAEEEMRRALISSAADSLRRATRGRDRKYHGYGSH